MKYIMEKKYEIKCEYYYYVTHGGDCCSHESAICPNRGLPCQIKIEDLPDHLQKYSIDKDMAEELMDKIDNKDLAWALSNLQSNNVYKKIVANYIVSSVSDKQ